MTNSLLQTLPLVPGKYGWPWDEEVDPDIYYKEKQWPKISIVTPSYNQSSFIEETIRSILLQNYPNIEYVIIDGGSTDNSADVIKKYSIWLKAWKSERDKGQADAINKGFLMCDGEIFNWLNSDDFLEKGALYNIALSFLKGADTVAGKVFNFYPDSPDLNDYTQNRSLEIETFLALKGVFHQPGIWCSFSLYKKAGLLPINSTYYFDKIFFSSYFLLSTKIIYTDNVLVNFRMHQDSKTTLIRISKLTELIDHYKHLLNSKQYSTYHQGIKEGLNNILIPEQILTPWYIEHVNQSSFKKIGASLKLLIKHPHLISTRYVFVVIKKLLKNKEG